MEIKIVVTKERFDQVFDVDSAFYIWDCTDKEVYDYMVQFVVDEKGAYLEAKEARKLFKQVKRTDLQKYMLEFIDKIREAFVPKESSGS